MCVVLLIWCVGRIYYVYLHSQKVIVGSSIIRKKTFHKRRHIKSSNDFSLHKLSQRNISIDIIQQLYPTASCSFSRELFHYQTAIFFTVGSLLCRLCGSLPLGTPGHLLRESGWPYAASAGKGRKREEEELGSRNYVLQKRKLGT